MTYNRAKIYVCAVVPLHSRKIVLRCVCMCMSCSEDHFGLFKSSGLADLLSAHFKKGRIKILDILIRSFYKCLSFFYINFNNL